MIPEKAKFATNKYEQYILKYVIFEAKLSSDKM